VKCEDLTLIENQICKRQGQGAQNVCFKVQKNKRICDGNQDFIKRLYAERDGK